MLPIKDLMRPIDLTKSDFTPSELETIIQRGVLLIQNGYITSLNYIQSPQRPRCGIVFHYFQDSYRHLMFIRKMLAPSTDNFMTPRLTFYLFDPAYARKTKFEEIYSNARFYDHNLHEIPIKRVLRNPHIAFVVAREEYDLIIPFDSTRLIGETARNLRRWAKRSPDPWIDPAILIKSEHPLPSPVGFSERDIAFLSRGRCEFYSALTNRRRRRMVEIYLRGACAELQSKTESSLDNRSVLFFPGQINNELLNYIHRNQQPLRLIE